MIGSMQETGKLPITYRLQPRLGVVCLDIVIYVYLGGSTPSGLNLLAGKLNGSYLFRGTPSFIFYHFYFWLYLTFISCRI